MNLILWLVIWPTLLSGPGWNSVARQKPLTERILTGEDFRKGRVDLGSGDNEAVFAVKIHPSLAPFKFRIVPDRSSVVATGNSPQRIGRIEISKQGFPGIDQVIEVQSFGDTAMMMKYFTLEDVNFDGYLDIGMLYEFGAKWGSYNYLVYDPATGRFIGNQLTSQLAAIRANGRTFDAQQRTIHFSFLLPGEGRIGETYKERNQKLILTGIEERRKGSKGRFEIVTKRVRNGRMTIASVKGEHSDQQ